SRVRRTGSSGSILRQTEGQSARHDVPTHRRTSPSSACSNDHAGARSPSTRPHSNSSPHSLHAARNGHDSCHTATSPERSYPQRGHSGVGAASKNQPAASTRRKSPTFSAAAGTLM